jgi:hypothetical protein
MLLASPGARYISGAMTRFLDMSDRARLPWRFFGAPLSDRGRTRQD